MVEKVKELTIAAVVKLIRGAAERVLAHRSASADDRKLVQEIIDAIDATEQ